MPREHIHLEVFQSLSGDPFAETPVDDMAQAGEAAEAEISIDGEVHSLRWPMSRNLVDVMLAAGIDVPFSCREGNCGSCAATLVDGDGPGQHRDPGRGRYRRRPVPGLSGMPARPR